MTMRRFAIVKPEVLWTGYPGRHLRDSPEAFKLAAYLLTGPESDMWGIWHLEARIVREYLGMTSSKYQKAFDVLTDIKWAYLNKEWVYIPELPASQFTRWPLLPLDNNTRAAKRWYEELPENPFLGAWFDQHLADLCLRQEPQVTRRGTEGPPAPPAPSVEELEVFDLLGKKIVEKGLSTAELDRWFARMVEIYPKKDKLHRARTMLRQLQPTAILMDEIWAALAWQVRQPDWLKEGGRYAPSLYSYLREKRWLDKPRTLPYLNESTVQAMQTIEDFANEEIPCTEPRTNVRGLPPRSKKLPS